MSRWGPLVLGTLVALGCARLGLWQLDRLEQRRARNAVIEARLAMPTVALSGDVSEALAADATEDASHPFAYRRASARGVFDFTRQLVVVGRTLEGVTGVYVVTPLRLRGGGAILVERGWVPSVNARAIDLGGVVEADTTTVEGVLLGYSTAGSAPPGESGWPRFERIPSPRRLAAVYPYPLARLVLRRTAVPEPAPGRMRGIPLPERSAGPHLSYAIQWFAFAAIAVVGAGALVWRRGGDEMENARETD